MGIKFNGAVPDWIKLEWQRDYYHDLFLPLLNMNAAHPDDVVGVLREVIRQDLFFLSHFIVGRDLVANPLHCKWIAEWEHCYRNSVPMLMLWARGHLKSSVFNYDGVIFQILNDPNERIAIFSETKLLAIAHMQFIKEELESNEMLKWLFPDILYQDARRSKRWLQDKITVKRSLNDMSCTMQAFGIDSLPVGTHFGRIVYDDIITEKTVNTKELLEKSKKQYHLSLSLLDTPDCPTIAIGTRYDYNDLYKDMIEEPDRMVSIVPAIWKDGTVSFPKQFSKAALDKRKKEIDLYTWNCQYMLEPVDPTTAKIKRDWIRYYRLVNANWKGKWIEVEIVPADGSSKEVAIERLSVNLFVLVDAAVGKGEKNDYTVVNTIAVDDRGRWFDIFIDRGRFTAGETIERMYHAKHKYLPMAFGIESEKLGMMLTDNLQKEQIDRKEALGTLHPISTAGGWYSRIITAVTPRMERHEVFIQEHQLELEDEMLRFPNASHDDILITVASLAQIEIKPDAYVYMGSDEYAGEMQEMLENFGFFTKKPPEEYFPEMPHPLSTVKI